MRLLFVIDAPESLNPKKDSTIALMRAAAQRGDDIYYATCVDFSQTTAGIAVTTRRLSLSSDDRQWMTAASAENKNADFFDATLMRKEPPVDDQFVMATRFLDAFPTPVYNAPHILREWNEKLAIFRFPEHIAPTWVGADIAVATAFHRQHGTVVLKPLDGMGGRGIYIAAEKDLNFHSVFDMLSARGARAIMAQQYLPAVRETGDCRVFVVGGKPSPWMLARIPRDDDHRGNMAAGGTAKAQPLSAAAEHIANAVAPALLKAGILFAGLDVIGGKLTEINITCPTGLREVSDQTGENIATAIINKIS